MRLLALQRRNKKATLIEGGFPCFAVYLGRLGQIVVKYLGREQCPCFIPAMCLTIYSGCAPSFSPDANTLSSRMYAMRRYVQ